MTPFDNQRWRWNLRTLLLVVVPVCAALAYGTAEFRRVKRATDAWLLMLNNAEASPQSPFVDGVFSFKQGAVSDAELIAFIPACNGPLPNGLGTIRALELNGAKVSDEAIAEFKTAVPDCEIRR